MNPIAAIRMIYMPRSMKPECGRSSSIQSRYKPTKPTILSREIPPGRRLNQDDKQNSKDKMACWGMPKCSNVERMPSKTPRAPTSMKPECARCAKIQPQRLGRYHLEVATGSDSHLLCASSCSTASWVCFLKAINAQN